jgi:uncharacterized YigZ family protein
MKFNTVEKDIVVKNVIKRSIFIGTVKKVSNLKEVVVFLDVIKEKYKDANHNPYAYRLITGEQYYSDDGEPGGSAGVPIFNAIRHFDVYNICVVVTRYFGGVKLGIPGLIEAYGSTAEFAIKSANIVEDKTTKTLEVRFPYSSFNFVNYALSKIPHKIVKREFTEDGLIVVQIDEDLLDEFSSLLKKDGRINFSVLNF